VTTKTTQRTPLPIARDIVGMSYPATEESPQLFVSWILYMPPPSPPPYQFFLVPC
jgi:hypothetical protein